MAKRAKATSRRGSGCIDGDRRRSAVPGKAIRVAPARPVVRTTAAMLLAGTCLGAIAILAPHSALDIDGA